MTDSSVMMNGPFSVSRPIREDEPGPANVDQTKEPYSMHQNVCGFCDVLAPPFNLRSMTTKEEMNELCRPAQQRQHDSCTVHQGGGGSVGAGEAGGSTSLPQGDGVLLGITFRFGKPTSRAQRLSTKSPRAGLLRAHQ
eukprot:SAG31_NODE_119_length_23948_cov_9.957105_4_plen_138_part_00